jgi:hypothetical protein
VPLPFQLHQSKAVQETGNEILLLEANQTTGLKIKTHALKTNDNGMIIVFEILFGLFHYFIYL